MTQRYDTYKDSGVQWLGEIPGHWECVPIRRIAYVNPTRTKNLDIDSYVGYAPMERIRCDNMNPSKIKVSKLTSGLTYCEEGDIVLAKVTPCFENGNLAIVPQVEQGCCYASSELFVFRAKDRVMPRFLLYTFLNRGFINAGASTMRGTGGLKRVTTEFANSAATPVPPLSEQHSIVSFLDAKCGKIDEWVTKKQKEVEHLQELKQRVIADAVTRGLNPHVKMKATNIPWLKEIPEHWEIKRLKYLVSCNDESLTNTENPNLEINYVEIGDVNDINGIAHITKYRFEDAPSRARRKTRKDDVIVSTVRTYLKAIAKVPDNGIIVSTGFAVLRAIDVNSSYLAFCCISSNFIDSVVALSKGISYPAITASELLNLFIPVPPLSEQKQIVSYLEDKTSKIDKLIANITKEIECIKEYKQRLISDVVTGQIKVC